MQLSPVVAVLAILFSFILSTPARAYETDQYSYVHHDLVDSIDILDEVINNGLQQLVDSWRGPKDPKQFARRAARLFSSRQLERWVNVHPRIESVNDKQNSIYKTTATFHSFIIRTKGLASTFVLNGIHIGADKMSHFFGVGGILYRVAEINNADKSPEERLQKALKHSRMTEELYWGELTTNVYSNADLVVNYEGYQFFQSLNHDNVVPGKKAIIRWVGNKPFMQRKFTFRDHVNDFWSEAMNPNYFQTFLGNRVEGVLREYCLSGYYEQYRDKLVSPREEELREKYKILKLKERGLRYRMDNVCAGITEWNSRRRQRFIDRQHRMTSRLRDKMKGSNVSRFKDKPLSEIIEDTGMPTCKAKLRMALMEHEALMDNVRSNRGTSRMMVDAALSRLASSPLSADPGDLFRRGELEFETVFYDENIGVEYKAVSSKDTREVFHMARYNDGYARVCREVATDFGDLEVRSNTVLKYVRCKDSLGRSKEFYDYQRGGTERFSIEDYQSMDDSRAFVFRTVPMLCRWY